MIYLRSVSERGGGSHKIFCRLSCVLREGRDRQTGVW